MGEVIQLQGDQRKDIQEFIIDKKEGLGLDPKKVKVCITIFQQWARHDDLTIFAS